MVTKISQIIGSCPRLQNKADVATRYRFGISISFFRYGPVSLTKKTGICLLSDKVKLTHLMNNM